jgi:phospholipase C
MKRQWKLRLQRWLGQGSKQPVRRRLLTLEHLEDRSLPSVNGPFQHVLLLSVDGLHAADVADPTLQGSLPTIQSLQQQGVTYTNASTTTPSDSFPGTLSYLTGAGPGTTGVYYDDTYSRTLLPPLATGGGSTPGTEAAYFENLDKNSALISGGGNFDASSIDANQLPRDPKTGQPVYPNQFLQTNTTINTIFDVAHDAGLYTAFSDKHPAYQIANGTDPNAINDFYGPEINSTTALLDTTTGKTVNADALLNRNTQPAQGLTIAQGYNASVFAAGPAGATQPDSITVDGLNVYVGYQNGAAKDGSSGSSTIAQFTMAPATSPNNGTKGHWAVSQTWTLPGHIDGLKVDPNTHRIWALENEDANPRLFVIDPVNNTVTEYSIASVNHGGGFDDIAFSGGNVYLTASNPTNTTPNTDPAVVQVTLSGTTAMTTPILNGNAMATDVTTGKQVTLNLTDPDSMTTAPNGDLILTSQADNELVDIHNPGTAGQTVQLLPLSDANKNPVSVDDTLLNPGAVGEMLLTDQKTGIIYQVTVPAGSSFQAFSAAQDLGQLGTTDFATGLFTPVISGLGSPRGLAFLNAGPYADLSQYKLVDASTDPAGASDPNLINDTTHNVLLTEKYDDLKVQAIVNEIDGQPSHTSPRITNPQVPAIFGMNFQAVSVAQKYYHGGINLVGGAEMPSDVLQAALQHTDASIGRIVQELKNQNLYDSTLLVTTAKHGQDPRVGDGQLIKDNVFTNLISKAGVKVAQQTADDAALIWLADQKQTDKAADALEFFRTHGTIDVFDQGVKSTVPASDVINQILSGEALQDSNLGNPRKDATTPDIIITLKPGFILVGNPNNFQFKRAEHGGFSPDDFHDALIVSSGGLDQSVQGTQVNDPVQTTQIAVTALRALGLDPEKLRGAEIEGTLQLPGLKLEAVSDRHEDGQAGLQQIHHFVVIYQENWSFDALYGSFPGANGIANASATSLSQIDRLGGAPYTSQLGQPFDLSVKGPALTTPPQPINNNVSPSVIDSRFPAGLDTLHPYDLGNVLSPADKTGDIVHRFFQEQSQINHGAQNGYLTWSDNPGLDMSYFNATNLPEGQLAQQYTMDDNFFHAAFGGSFLNHQFLVSAAAPVYPNAPSSLQATVDANGQLVLNPNGTIKHDGNVTAAGSASFGDPGQTYNNTYAINTIFSPNLVPDFFGPVTPSNAFKLLPSINDSNPNSPNYQPNIGDSLDKADISWKWYSGGWDNALAASPSNPSNHNAVPSPDPADPNFQWHHQPLAYYDNFAPWLPNGQRNPLSAAHLQDETNFFSDLSNGDLPAVSFIKPIGENNEHPGYADVLQGQQHVADIVHAIQNSPDWAHTAIIITYDENGGRWDHVSPPDANGIWGDGTRVPAIVISPFARQGYVDHEQHDTLSILKTIDQRFGLAPLNDLVARASSLADDFVAPPNGQGDHDHGGQGENGGESSEDQDEGGSDHGDQGGSGEQHQEQHQEQSIPFIVSSDGNGGVVPVNAQESQSHGQSSDQGSAAAVQGGTGQGRSGSQRHAHDRQHHGHSHGDSVLSRIAVDSVFSQDPLAPAGARA